MEIPTSGNPFTWRRSSSGINNIHEIIDRTLVQDQILQWFPMIATHNFAFSSSDHCLITTSLTNTNSFKAQPFKFENIWTERKDFENLVKQAWRTNQPGSLMFQLVKKTNHVKIQAKKWNKTTFGNIFRQLEDIEKQLIDTQKRIILQNSTELMTKQKNLLRKKRIHVIIS